MKKFNPLKKLFRKMIDDKKFNNRVFLAACISMGIDIVAIEWCIFTSGANAGIKAAFDVIENTLKEAKNHE